MKAKSRRHRHQWLHAGQDDKDIDGWWDIPDYYKWCKKCGSLKKNNKISKPEGE